MDLEKELLQAKAERAWIRRKLEEERKKRHEEKERYKKDLDMILCGASVLGCLFVAITCAIAAPWWTAVSPLVLAWAVLRKAGW